MSKETKTARRSNDDLLGGPLTNWLCGVITVLMLLIAFWDIGMHQSESTQWHRAAKSIDRHFFGKPANVTDWRDYDPSGRGR